MESRSAKDAASVGVAALTVRIPYAENTPAETIRELHELIAALDRRVPHVERAGEVSIARAASALKEAALKRIEDLEREVRSAPPR